MQSELWQNLRLSSLSMFPLSDRFTAQFLLALYIISIVYNVRMCLPYCWCYKSLLTAEVLAKNSRFIDPVLIVCFRAERIENIGTFCWQDRYQGV